MSGRRAVQLSEPRRDSVICIKISSFPLVVAGPRTLAWWGRSHVSALPRDRRT